MYESAQYPVSSFVTLSYDEEHLGVPSLRYRDFQLFMKRLRKRFGPTRFYMCGEYGEQFKRPHFHACLFGLYLPDRKFRTMSKGGFPLYTSEALASVWGQGFCLVGDVSFESAAYVARYIMKKVTGPAAEEYYGSFVDSRTGELHQVVPEFSHMSLKPGIGATWIERYHADVYPNDAVYIRDRKGKPPKFFDKWFRAHYPQEWEGVEFDRYVKGLKMIDENSPGRLATREAVASARVNQYKREGL